MNLSIHYNWPIGEDSAHVTLGQENVNDRNMEFRIGLLPEDHPGMVRWYKDGWMLGSDMIRDVSFFAKRGDKIVVERREPSSDNIERIRVWDISEEWPPEAHGPSTTVVPWYF